MQHIIVFSYIFTILIGVSALTIQWLAGKGEQKKNLRVMRLFIVMLLVLNMYDFLIYYFDNIINSPSGNLMLSFGDCLIAILVFLWLWVEMRMGKENLNMPMLKWSGIFVAVYLLVWLVAVLFFVEYKWIRLVIDIPLVCLLVMGSMSIIFQGKQRQEDTSFLIYKGLITLFIAGNYTTYLISESGLLLSTGKNIMDVTIFFWLAINIVNMVMLYKKDFVESFLQGTGGKEQLSTEAVMELLKEKYDLTKREIEILHEVYDGKSNVQIAEDLYISESTVKAHIYNIFRKMNVKSRVEAVCIVREEKEGK